MGCHIRGVLFHTSELVDIEEGVIYPYSFLLEKYRHTVLYINRNGH
jgi:hypothetical protein